MLHPCLALLARVERAAEPAGANSVSAADRSNGVNQDSFSSPAQRRSLGRADLHMLKLCLEKRARAIRELAEAACQVDHAVFHKEDNFGQAHQRLLKALDQAEEFMEI